MDNEPPPTVGSMTGGRTEASGKVIVKMGRNCFGEEKKRNSFAQSLGLYILINLDDNYLVDLAVVFIVTDEGKKRRSRPRR